VPPLGFGDELLELLELSIVKRSTPAAERSPPTASPILEPRLMAAMPASVSPVAVSLEGLTEDTRAKVIELFDRAKAAGMTLSLTSGRRTCAAQNALYAQGGGTTHARGCQSWHVLGRAVDVAIVGGPKDWQLLGSIGRGLGFKWGGDWTGPNAPKDDVGHFEYHPGLTIEDVCPDPSACRDNMVTTLPPTIGDWQTSGCSALRFRVHRDGPIEIDGEGIVRRPLPSRVMEHAPLIRASSRKVDFPAHVIAGTMGLESGGDERAVSPAGALGAMQLMPSTAEWLAGRPVTKAELLEDVALNVDLGAKYLRQLWDKYKANLVRALTAYNAGSAICGTGCMQRGPKGADGKRPCLDDPRCTPNRWELVADCTKGKTVDYAGIIIGYSNTALAAFPMQREQEPPGERPPGPGPSPTPPFPVPLPFPIPPPPVAELARRSSVRWGVVSFAAGLVVLGATVASGGVRWRLRCLGRT